MTKTETRAEYFRKRRENRRTFSVLLDPETAERLDRILSQRGETRVSWLRRKIAEEIEETDGQG